MPLENQPQHVDHAVKFATGLPPVDATSIKVVDVYDKPADAKYDLIDLGGNKITIEHEVVDESSGLNNINFLLGGEQFHQEAIYIVPNVPPRLNFTKLNSMPQYAVFKLPSAKSTPPVYQFCVAKVSDYLTKTVSTFSVSDNKVTDQETYSIEQCLSLQLFSAIVDDAHACCAVYITHDFNIVSAVFKGGVVTKQTLGKLQDYHWGVEVFGRLIDLTIFKQMMKLSIESNISVGDGESDGGQS